MNFGLIKPSTITICSKNTAELCKTSLAFKKMCRLNNFGNTSRHEALDIKTRAFLLCFSFEIRDLSHLTQPMSGLIEIIFQLQNFNLSESVNVLSQPKKTYLLFHFSNFKTRGPLSFIVVYSFLVFIPAGNKI